MRWGIGEGNRASHDSAARQVRSDVLDSNCPAYGRPAQKLREEVFGDKRALEESMGTR